MLLLLKNKNNILFTQEVVNKSYFYLYIYIFLVNPILQEKLLRCELNEGGFTKKCSFILRSNPEYNFKYLNG